MPVDGLLCDKGSMREKSALDKGGIRDLGELLAMIFVIARNRKVAGFHLAGFLSFDSVKFGHYTISVVFGAQKNRRAENRAPQPALIAHRALRAVHRAPDLIGDAIDRLFFVP